jgi:Xaa-Pro aminopeptidase
LAAVLAMQPTLLVGPADWDPARMPRDEFLARATALWRGAPAAGGAIVYGDRAHHAELAYLTGFTPKLEAALALIPRVGAPRLLVGGGVNMLPAAKPLTFIENLLPLRNVGATAAQWAREQSGGGRPVLIGGALMPYPLRRQIDDAIAEGAGPIADKTSELWTLMRRKSARELAAIREACASLDATVPAMSNAQRSGSGATATILAGEHAAYRRGAQDVRTLFSLDGGRTLRPFETTVERAIDPLQVYVAVRQFGYWAEGFAVVTASPNRCVEGAGEVLRYAIEMIRAGRRRGDIARSITEAVHPLRPHPVTGRILGNSIGLALEEPPLIATDSEDPFEAGEVYSLRVGLSDEHDHAIASAMIAVHEFGSSVLWSSPEGLK